MAKKAVEKAETTYTVPTGERESQIQEQSEEADIHLVNVEAATGSQHLATSVVIHTEGEMTVNPGDVEDGANH